MNIQVPLGPGPSAKTLPWFGTLGFSLCAFCCCLCIGEFLRFPNGFLWLAPESPKIMQFCPQHHRLGRNRCFEKSVLINCWVAFGLPHGTHLVPPLAIIYVSGALLVVPCRHQCRCRLGKIEVFRCNGFPNVLVDAKQGAVTSGRTTKLFQMVSRGP